MSRNIVLEADPYTRHILVATVLNSGHFLGGNQGPGGIQSRFGQELGDEIEEWIGSPFNE
jgi:lipid-binding SYLF domain-containing protein